MTGVPTINVLIAFGVTDDLVPVPWMLFWLAVAVAWAATVVSGLCLIVFTVKKRPLARSKALKWFLSTLILSIVLTVTFVVLSVGLL